MSRSRSASPGFNGKVAVVTGAGSGIGRSLALGLVRRGSRLAISDVNETALRETASLVGLSPSDLHVQRLDVSDRDAQQRYADSVATHFGVVHQVFNNAGIGRNGPTLTSDFSHYELVMAVNHWGVVYGTKAFLPHLVASGDGHVVNVSSLNGLMAYSGLTAYCASKYAVRGFTEALRIEMLETGQPVRVTIVHPGGVRTNLTKNALDAAEAAGRPVTGETLASAKSYEARFMRMSPDAAANAILDGVAKGKGRILVGNDAKLMDRVVRAIPGQYPRLVAALQRKMRNG